MSARNVWSCKIGAARPLVDDADLPMRRAVMEAYKVITGQRPDFVFSGWDANLTAIEGEEVSKWEQAYERMIY
jgi:hypothetical protein